MPAPASRGAVMDPAERLRQEVSCPVCLDYFLDPVIIDCGHNFCLRCITRTWGGLTMGPCPECRAVSQGAAPRRNLVLVSVVGLVKQLNLNRKKWITPQSCPAHAELLNIYCLEDQKALCVLCTMSFRHFSHHLLPLEQAIKEGKVPQSEAYTGSTLQGPTEVCCNSCLVTVTDPITTTCGHNFCRVCVTRTWVCPTCKPKPKARLFAPAVMFTPITVLDDITSAVSDLDEPEPQREVRCSCWSVSQHYEISKPHLQVSYIELNHRKSAEEVKYPLSRSKSFSAPKSATLMHFQKLKERQEQKSLYRSRLVEVDNRIAMEDEKILHKAPFSSLFKSFSMFQDVNRLRRKVDATQEDAANAAKPATYEDVKCGRCGLVKQVTSWEDNFTAFEQELPFTLSSQRDKKGQEMPFTLSSQRAIKGQEMPFTLSSQRAKKGQEMPFTLSSQRDTKKPSILSYPFRKT